MLGRGRPLRAEAGGRKAGAGKPAKAPSRRGAAAAGPTWPPPPQRKVGRCDDCPPTYDEATFEALRTWRLTVATETEVPAYVVFTDATLTAIAERKPSDIAALATISGVGAAKLGPLRRVGAVDPGRC